MDEKNRIEELLIENYQFIKNHKGNTDANKVFFIKGFMEACLMGKLVSRVELEQIINRSHKTVFGVEYEKRIDLRETTEEWLDIPTHIRRKQALDEN